MEWILRLTEFMLWKTLEVKRKYLFLTLKILISYHCQRIALKNKDMVIFASNARESFLWK